MDTLKKKIISVSFKIIVTVGAAAILSGYSLCIAQTSVADAHEQVVQTEKAFALSMKDRDFEAFKSFISPEAVFLSGKNILRGTEHVADWWKHFFNKPKAPFSWEPQTVEVISSGTLALSTGPVFDSEGKQIATFTSIWRLETGGKWHIIFDKGCPLAH